MSICQTTTRRKRYISLRYGPCYKCETVSDVMMFVIFPLQLDVLLNFNYVLLIWLRPAIGGVTGQLLEQSANALDQISANFSAFKVSAFTLCGFSITRNEIYVKFMSAKSFL